MEKFYLHFTVSKGKYPHSIEAKRLLLNYLQIDGSLTAAFETHTHKHVSNFIYFICTAHSRSTGFSYASSS